ncbi:MAG: hypothetical protein LBR56_08490 [Sporomusaceae bacterium]|jgi:hypothetical protein|nr:hypothetical protein [Sporomusaceae bacterium]
MLLDDGLMMALDDLQPQMAEAANTDSFVYARGCGCTGNCGQSCSGGCKVSCTGNCGRSCSGNMS